MAQDRAASIRIGGQGVQYLVYGAKSMKNASKLTLDDDEYIVDTKKSKYQNVTEISMQERSIITYREQQLELERERLEQQRRVVEMQLHNGIAETLEEYELEERLARERERQARESREEQWKNMVERENARSYRLMSAEIEKQKKVTNIMSFVFHDTFIVIF